MPFLSNVLPMRRKLCEGGYVDGSVSPTDRQTGAIQIAFTSRR
jgi:hypothetical protein